MNPLITYALISLWSVALVGIGFSACEYATRSVVKFEQVPMLEVGR